MKIKIEVEIDTKTDADEITDLIEQLMAIKSQLALLNEEDDD